MTVPVRMHPDAESELEGAETYYFQIYPRLQAMFRLEVKQFSEYVSIHPKMFARYEGEIRRYVLRGFPYSIYYEILPDEIIIYALGYNSRRSRYWHNRTQKT